MLKEKKQWASPSTFNPQHFLDHNGNFKKNPAFMAFSAGRIHHYWNKWQTWSTMVFREFDDLFLHPALFLQGREPVWVSLLLAWRFLCSWCPFCTISPFPALRAPTALAWFQNTAALPTFPADTRSLPHPGEKQEINLLYRTKAAIPLTLKSTHIYGTLTLSYLAINT